MTQIRERDAREHLSRCDGWDNGRPCACQVWEVIPNYAVPGAYHR